MRTRRRRLPHAVRADAGRALSITGQRRRAVSGMGLFRQVAAPARGSIQCGQSSGGAHGDRADSRHQGSELVDTYPLAWPTLEPGGHGHRRHRRKPLDLALLDGRHDRHDAHHLQASRHCATPTARWVGKRAWRARSRCTSSPDWRRPIEQAAAAKMEFCAEIEGRLKSLGCSEPLHFISHSMAAWRCASALGLQQRARPLRRRRPRGVHRAALPRLGRAQ